MRFEVIEKEVIVMSKEVNTENVKEVETERSKEMVVENSENVEREVRDEETV